MAKPRPSKGQVVTSSVTGERPWTGKYLPCAEGAVVTLADGRVVAGGVYGHRPVMVPIYQTKNPNNFTGWCSFCGSRMFAMGFRPERDGFTYEEAIGAGYEAVYYEACEKWKPFQGTGGGNRT